MSARDLLQRRTTTDQGETVWVDSPIVAGMREGRLVVLDGVHRLAPGVLAVLARLVVDRECVLFDGTRFVRTDAFQRYDALAFRGFSCVGGSGFFFFPQVQRRSQPFFLTFRLMSATLPFPACV